MMMRRMWRKGRCLWVLIGLTGQNISPIGRFFLTLYKQSCGSLSMLMLDHTTLFYFSLRDLNADQHAQLVHDWVRKVPSNVNPKGTHRKSTPPLTHRSTRSSHAPQLTQSTFHAAHTRPHDHSVQFSEVGCSDINETGSDEQEPTIKSPPTGRQMSSSVSPQFITIFPLTFWTVSVSSSGFCLAEP